ncbi:conserved protein, unknown function [Hepatocystis sp. ex Piliocolobus tephrosceles]|nr:conserved protein, unknown function [Hepatocystis sp. ex Piliocolobus tephrosceles]
MELLDIKNTSDTPVCIMTYSDLQVDVASDLSSNEESQFFSAGDFASELDSSFDDISDYILVDDSDSKKDVSGNASSVSMDSSSTKDVVIGKKRNIKIKREMKILPFSKNNKIITEGVRNIGDNKKGGTCRTLGTEGRKRMLKLLRRAYKYNDHCKIVMKENNPPLSISYLPYFNLSMLWQLAEDFGVYGEALKIHNECIKKRNTSVRYKNGSSSCSSSNNNKNSSSCNSPNIIKNAKTEQTEYVSNYLSPYTKIQITDDNYDTLNSMTNDDKQKKGKKKKKKF